MKRILNTGLLLAALVILLHACSKKEELLLKPIKEYKPFTMSGFALGELEQYFDGVKVRDLYQMIPTGDQIGFDKDETVMELRVKATGEKIYEQKFKIADAENRVPKFYFDGKKMYNTYTYPAPVGKEYKANFYFDFPADSGKLDLVAVVMEYYYDWDNDEDPLVIVGTHEVPIASNIEPGKWSEYITLSVLPTFTKSHPESEFYPYACVKKSGKPGYMVSDDMEQNTITLEFPESWTTEGKVQSIYVGFKREGIKDRMTPQYDLVQVFQ